VFGGVLKQGDSFAVGNLNLGAGQRLFLGTGDRSVRQTNLFLNSGGFLLKQHRSGNHSAVFAHQPGPGAHPLTIGNFQSTGPAVMMMAVFDLY
jgi:hypothetical protein